MILQKQKPREAEAAASRLPTCNCTERILGLSPSPVSFFASAARPSVFAGPPTSPIWAGRLLLSEQECVEKTSKTCHALGRLI